MDKSYVIQFFQFFMQNILPYEVKYSTLKRKKSYELHRVVIEELLYSFHSDTGEDEFLEVMKKLEEVALVEQQNYYDLLVKRFQEKLNPEVLAKSYERYNDKEYLEAIEIVESALGIVDKRQEVIPHEKMELHIVDSIYDKEYDKLKEALLDFREALWFLNEEIEERKAQENKEKEQLTANCKHAVTTKEYLQYVVFNEGWNFLSHIAFAVGNFSTPRVYINNIEKGIAHLRRAVLDIYDGLILETRVIDQKYLKIRSLKLNSLGNESKIIKLSDKLKKYYIESEVKSHV